MKTSWKKFRIFWMFWMIAGFVFWYCFVPDEWKAVNGFDNPIMNSAMLYIIMVFPGALRYEILYIIPGIKKDVTEFMELGKEGENAGQNERE